MLEFPGGAFARRGHGSAPPGAPRFVSVQNEYSLLVREPERGVLATTAELGAV